jgi:hypothetical protein
MAKMNTDASLHYRLPLLSLCAALTLGGCATTNNGGKAETIATGVATGCAAGALIAIFADGNVGTGCVAGGVLGGFAGYAYARKDELKEGKLLVDAASGVDGASISPIETDSVALVDEDAEKTNIVEAFKLLSVDIPVDRVSTVKGQEVIRRLQAYARKMADQRGETIDIITAVAPGAAIKARKTETETVEAAGKGSVRQVRVADPGISPKVHRITIEAKNPLRVVQNEIEV